jgi:hypothetical protein
VGLNPRDPGDHHFPAKQPGILFFIDCHGHEVYSPDHDGWPTSLRTAKATAEELSLAKAVVDDPAIWELPREVRPPYYPPDAPALYVRVLGPSGRQKEVWVMCLPAGYPREEARARGDFEPQCPLAQPLRHWLWRTRFYHSLSSERWAPSHTDVTLSKIGPSFAIGRRRTCPVTKSIRELLHSHAPGGLRDDEHGRLSFRIDSSEWLRFAAWINGCHTSIVIMDSIAWGVDVEVDMNRIVSSD